DREAFDGAVSELLLLLSRGVALRAGDREAAGREGALAEALRLNELAEAWGPERGSQALWQQRAEIYRLLGRADEARQAGRPAEADDDFGRAIARRPALAEAYCNRALARVSLKKYREAIEDLDRALALGADPAYVLFLRADARQRAGDPRGAREDREEGMRH